MKRNHIQNLEKTPLVLSYRRANLFDVPMIFQLIQEGAEAGAFSDVYVTRTGCTKLLGMALRSVVLQFFQSSNGSVRYEWQVISNADGVEVGFLKVSNGIGVGKDSNLEILAICAEHRNQGIGSAVLENIQSKVPHGGQLYVHCTKYARAMQHILKRHRLKRNVKFRVPNLEEYQSDWVDLPVSRP